MYSTIYIYHIYIYIYIYHTIPPPPPSYSGLYCLPRALSKQPVSFYMAIPESAKVFYQYQSGTFGVTDKQRSKCAPEPNHAM